MQWQLPQIDAVSPENMHAFEQSISARRDPNELGGKFIREFARGLPGVELPSHLGDKISREAIHALAKDPTVNTLTVFLMPDDTPDNKPIGYIMDQWAGCSINLLFNSDIVLMDSMFIWKSIHGGLEHTATFIVSNQNTGKRYERFCSAIEILKKHFGLTGHQIDRALLSTGGRQMASWRNHVILHRKPKQHGN